MVSSLDKLTRKLNNNLLDNEKNSTNKQPINNEPMNITAVILDNLNREK